MASVLTYNQIIELLTDIARRHFQINTFYLGKNWELENSDDILFPLFQVYPDFGSLKANAYNEYKTQEVRFVCKVVDTTTPGEGNERDVHSDTLRICQDIVNEFNQHPFYVRSKVKLIGDIDFLPLEEFKDDISAGWQFTLNFQIINLNTFCGMPIEEIPGFSATGPTSQGQIVDVKYLTCETLPDCPVIQDHEQRITDLESVVFYQNELISGGASFLSGLTFAVTDLVYIISGQLYTASATNVTINPGDPSLDRIDLIIADVNGNISVVEGTPDTNPVKPDIDESTQIEVTFINVPAGAVVIPIPITLVYDENTGTPSEWNTSTNYPTGIDFNATNIFYNGTKSIRLTNVPTAKTIVFTNSTPFDTTTQNTIQFAIKNNVAWTTTRRLRFTLQSASGVQIGNIVDIYHGQRGFSSTDITNWQIISIPIAAFAPTTSLISKVVITTYSTSGTLNLNMDYFRLIVGTPTISAQNTFLTIKDDGGLQTSATTPNDILTVSGGTNLTSVVTAKKITLNLDPNISLTSAILTGGTSNTLTYFNGSKSLSSVTLGSGFALTGGTLTYTQTVPTIAQVLTSGNKWNAGQLMQGFDNSTYFQLDNGYYLEFNDGSDFGTISIFDTSFDISHSANISLTAPAITLDNSSVIKTNNGGGQLDLDYFGSPGEVSLSTDGGNQSEAYLYLTPTSADLVGLSSSLSLQSNVATLNVGNSSRISIRTGTLGFSIDGRYNSSGSTEIIKFIDNFSTSFTTTNNVKPSLIIGSQNSTVNSGVTNSVILGGINMVASQSNTVYVPTLNIKDVSNNNALTQVLVRDGSDGNIRYRDVSTILSPTPTLQASYEISTPLAEITTNSTNGALSLMRGSAADTDNVLEIKNGAGTITASIDGNGKRNVRVTSIVSSATPTPSADTDDEYIITALATAPTFGAPTGTPSQGQVILIRIKDNGTARALLFNAIYRFSGDQPAPTTTIINKTMYIMAIYNAEDAKWDCMWRDNY